MSLLSLSTCPLVRDMVAACYRSGEGPIEEIITNRPMKEAPTYHRDRERD